MRKHADPQSGAVKAAADSSLYASPFKLAPATVVERSTLGTLAPVAGFSPKLTSFLFGRLSSLESAKSAVEDKAIKLVPGPSEPKLQQRDEKLGVPGEMLSAEAMKMVDVHRFDADTVDSLTFTQFFDLIQVIPFAQRVRALKAERDKSVHVETFLDGTPVQYNYDQMLQRIAPNTAGAMEKTLDLPGVRIEPAGRKTIWINFKKMCELLNRDVQDLKAFIEFELTTTSTLDGEQRLHIGISRATADKMQNLVKKFVSSHVLCGSCKGYNTSLVRNSSQRLVEVKCSDCKASRAVEQTGATGGFQAIANRRDRKRMRALA
jgi:translation initiation factor 2 subunit 2